MKSGILSGLLFFAAASAGADTPQSQRAWEVYQILERSCADCHGGHKKPKGDFGYVLDLKRLVERGDYVTPGEPENSDLYLLLIDEDPDLIMPPIDSDIPALSTNDIARVYDWILHGAGLGAVSSSNQTQSAAQPPPEASLSKKALMGKLHPLLVHFPIALLLAGVLASLVKPRSEAASWCLVLGTLGAVASAVTGWLHASAAGYSPDTVFNHRWLGVTCAVLAVTAVYTQCIMDPEGRRQRLLAFLLLILLALVVGLAGHTGGVLVYGEGFPF